MEGIYAETVSLCPVCATESPAVYHEERDGMYLTLSCPGHGVYRDKVESNSSFFMARYEKEYSRGKRHLVLPVTYRCNIRCKYCYSVSNAGSGVAGSLPEDRSSERLLGVIRAYPGSIMFAGGEPTLRDDLFDLISAAREKSGRVKVSVATNGQRLTDLNFVRRLRDSGLDFIFLSHNDRGYEPSETVFRNKTKALDNLLAVGMPVWLSRTIDHLGQIESLHELLSRYRKCIFNVTLRGAKAYGNAGPAQEIFASDMLKYLKKEDAYAQRRSPFNSHVRLLGKKVKICSWVNDVKRLDPLDDDYLISNDLLLPFHRGMKVDEVLLMSRMFPGKQGPLRG